MTATVHLDDPATEEKIRVVIGVDADPTAGDPQFTLVAEGASIAAATWSNGEWTDEGWSTARKRAVALTPTIGSAGTLETAAAGTYDLWWRVTLVDETPVKLAAKIVVA